MSYRIKPPFGIRLLMNYFLISQLGKRQSEKQQFHKTDSSRSQKEPVFKQHESTDTSKLLIIESHGKQLAIIAIYDLQ